MNEEQKNVISLISNQISIQPVANMQQLVSHWSTMEGPESSKRKRGHKDISPEIPVSESLATNSRSKRKILSRP